MKKIIILALIVCAGSYKNTCFAGDTLFVFFNSADSNQYVTKKIKRIYIPPLFKRDMCVIEKSCWFNFPLIDSGKTTQRQFCFTYLIVTDSIRQDESDAVDNAWDVVKVYEQLYRNCLRKDTMYKKRLAFAIKVFKEYNKHGHTFIKKDKFDYTAPAVINLGDIKTREQLTAFKDKLLAKTILLIDMGQQRKKNKWLAYKVAVKYSAPIEPDDLKIKMY